MRLIDADALKLDIMCVYGSNPQYINWLNHAPTVDAVPVVRCRNCRYSQWMSNTRLRCREWNGKETRPDGYCWKGKTWD